MFQNTIAEDLGNMNYVGSPSEPVGIIQDEGLAMNEEEHFEPWVLAWSPEDRGTSTGFPPHPHCRFQPHTGDSLLALGHLQEVEVDNALHVGMEGEEATQEVIPSQVEV